MIYVLINLLWLLPTESTVWGKSKNRPLLLLLLLFWKAIPLIHERMIVVKSGNKNW